MSLQTLLHTHFGHPEFRPGQHTVVEHVHDGNNALVVMPTGHGKSLCYQLPAISRGGTTIVVSPLIALMKDQVDTLHTKNIAATLINSTISYSERQQRIQQMINGEYRMVYVAPERFNERFMTSLAQTDVRMLAIDEAHCISQWGHDFRPDYLRIGEVRRALGNIPTIALTATATPDVQDDILKQLGMQDARRFITGFDRENLRLDVMIMRTPGAKHMAIPSVVRDLPALVYCATRKNVEAVTETLRQAGHSVAAYHAGIPHNTRKRVQEDFMSGQLPLVVATNAFGMGVDKANIRSIVHFDLPGTLEAYYQEIGRAGRDGKPAVATLMFRPADRSLQEFFIQGAHPPAGQVHVVYDLLRGQNENPVWWNAEEIARRTGNETRLIQSCLSVLQQFGLIARTSTRNPDNDDLVFGLQLRDPERDLELTEAQMAERRHHAFAQLEKMVAYGKAPCQRHAVLKYFGETPSWERCGRCTGCDSGQPMVVEARRISDRELESVRKVLACMARMRRPFSTSLIAKVVTGSKDKTVRTFGFDQLSTWGILSGWSQARVERLLGAMEDAALIEGILTSKDIRGSARTWKNLALTEHGCAVMRGDITDVALSMPKAAAMHKPTTTFDPTESNDGVVDEDLLAHLRQTRYRLAQDDSVPAYVVASNRTLNAIAAMRPTSIDALASIHGMGRKRITRYGDELIDAVRGWTRC